MTQYLRIALFVGLIMTAPAFAAWAQDAPNPTPSPIAQAQAKAQTPPPVQVEVVVSRYRADKKVSSAPYLLSVKPSQRANLRLMTSVPISVGVEKGYQYRDLGTAIDVGAFGPNAEGGYEVNVTISESSLVMDTPLREGSVSSTPLIRSYSSNNMLLLRDGQTRQYTAATEPVTGEVVRVEVTLRAVK